MKKLTPYLITCLLIILSACESDEGGSDMRTGGGGTGQGGSLARLTIVGNYMYRASYSTLETYDISDEHAPERVNSQDLGFGVETIFDFQNTLLIGTTTGMYIFSIDQPENPQQLSFYEHITACDPVVAQGSKAYVTLRDGSTCRNGENRLDIVDISNLENPYEIASYSLESIQPYGLGIDGNTLFVGLGTKGMRIYDVTDAKNIQTIETKDIDVIDVIPITSEKILITTGADGIYQYDYQKIDSITQLSKITVEQ